VGAGVSVCTGIGVDVGGDVGVGVQVGGSGFNGVGVGVNRAALAGKVGGGKGLILLWGFTKTIKNTTPTIAAKRSTMTVRTFQTRGFDPCELRASWSSMKSNESVCILFPFLP
jgi:hypothetical protein